MFLHYLKIAWRNLLKYKVRSVISVLGLAIGFMVFALSAYEQIAIVGIAVHDGYNRWKEALEEEKPGWLQFHDADGLVARAYEASVIPRYILIDKNGNIADMNAPGPGNKEALENKFREEMSK